MAEGTLPQDTTGSEVEKEGVVSSTSLDALISDDDLDKLVQYFEAGNQMTLEPRTVGGFPGADDETLEKAQKLVDTITASLEDGDERRNRQQEVNAAEIKAEAEAIARGEECELGRMYAEKMALEAK